MQNQIEEILNRGIAEINVKSDLSEKLKAGKKLRVKFGIDPTGFDLTLGHAVPLRKLKQFQDAGHHIILLFGNFTAQIGDPTGKSQTRKVLTKADVMQNAATYLEQAGKIIDTNKIEVVYNADWLENMSFSEVLKLAGNFTVAQMLERDMFQERIKNNREINLVEFMYPLMQGYDSVPLKADVEIGGTDQLFNMMCARPIQKSNGQEPQNVITVPILVGTDGHEKMSKSLGNYIALTDTPREMFGKTMSIPDDVILNYFELATEVSMDEIQKIKKDLEAGINPRDIKIRLGKEIVKLYHSVKDADQAEEEFINMFQKKGKPDEIEEISLEKTEYNIVDLISETQMVSSKSDARRMVEQGAVKVNDEKIDSYEKIIQIGDGVLVQVGKRKFLKIKT